MKIKNMLNFNLKISCGKRTYPAVIASCTAMDSGIIVGNETFSQQEISEWIEKALLVGLKKANSSKPSNR